MSYYDIGFISMTPRPLPPVSFLNECLKIDQSSPSGLTWLARPRNHFCSQRGYLISITRDAGNFAGTQCKSGDGDLFFVVKINQIKYPAHRIVFALANGVDPYPLEIDHIDRNPINNHPSNLRLADRSQNASNKGIQSNNTSGYRGVTYCKRTKKWMAQIGLHQKTIFLGRFKNKEDAFNARKEAQVKLHGEFSSFAL